MNELINRIESSIKQETEELAESLIFIIENNSITTEEELLKFENDNFTFKGQVLSREEKIDYCYNNIINSYYDADALDYSDLRIYNKYYDLLKNSKSIEEKIKYIVLLYEMTGRDQLLVYELYKYIINNNLN